MSERYEPTPLHTNIHGDNVIGFPGSLRDWFAGLAVSNLNEGYASFEDMALDAYAIADAMLAEREKPQEDKQ